MKKTVFGLVFFPIFLFSGVFEHLLDKDKNYLFEHNFRCHSSKCITSEKNIFDNESMDNSVKVIRTFLDHKQKVFKIEIELSIYNEEKDSFYNAIIKNADTSGNITYKAYEIDDKYGNHPFISIIDIKKQEKYIKFLTSEYDKVMKSYKN